jgi:hypothetical protein
LSDLWWFGEIRRTRLGVGVNPSFAEFLLSLNVDEVEKQVRRRSRAIFPHPTEVPEKTGSADWSDGRRSCSGGVQHDPMDYGAIMSSLAGKYGWGLK